ncbi:DUF1467 family protein [Halovulum sp. GXIMD14793]
MTITGAFVLFAVIWFLSLLVALPIGLRTQGDLGEIKPGTPASAPENPNIRKKIIWVTIVTIVLWLPLVIVIDQGWISIDDIDIWRRFRADQ